MSDKQDTIYVDRGSIITLSSQMDQPLTYKKLPVGTYEVGCSPDIGFFLKRICGFEIPSKLYGSTKTRAARFLTTFLSRRGTTGVLLSGLKGSGKSLEMKLTANTGLELGYSTIVVNAAWGGPAFNQFISSITDPCVVVFDEFEKVYNAKDQESLLTLLDGTFTTQKLMIFTSNNKYKVNTHMINRPGRIFYAIEFKGLEKDFIAEYCVDKLDNQELSKDILRVTNFIQDFNFDMLQALVEELNRYPQETVKQALQILNITFDEDSDSKYSVMVYDNENNQIMGITPSSITNPLQVESMYFEYREYNAKTKQYGEYKEVQFDEIDHEQLIVSPDLNRIELSNDAHRVVLIKPKPRQSFDYMSRF